MKKVFLEILQNSQENTCTRVFFNKVVGLLQQVFSCVFCEISKNTFSNRTLLVAAAQFSCSCKILIVQTQKSYEKLFFFLPF